MIREGRFTCSLWSGSLARIVRTSGWKHAKTQHFDHKPSSAPPTQLGEHNENRRKTAGVLKSICVQFRLGRTRYCGILVACAVEAEGNAD